MRKINLKFLLALIFFAIFIFRPVGASAAAALDLKVFPPTAYISAKPGAGVNHQVKLKNSGLYTLEVTPALVNFHGDEQTGQVILEQKSDFTYLNLDGDKDKWGKSFLIKPGEEQTLNFVIALPSDAEYKEHTLSILFQAKQLLYVNDSGRESTLSAVIVSNLVLLVSADDQDRGELTIEQFFLPKVADSFVGFSFSALAKNIGANATPIDGHIKISHWPDQNVEMYELYPDMVLAGNKRLVRAMSEDDLKTLESMEESKEIKIAAGENYEAQKAEFINQKLKTKQFYKKSFLIGAYDLELKVGDDILQKRVIVLPFSVLLVAILLPLIHWIFNLFKKTFKKPVDLNN